MKKIIAAFMFMAMAVILLPLEASAQTYTTRRVTRNGRTTTVRVYTSQQSRRYNGYNNRYNRNRITPQERARLARQQSRYYRTANRATRDGVITQREARKLNRQSNRYVRRVNRVRNN
jgi:hypothetical protein